MESKASSSLPLIVRGGFDCGFFEPADLLRIRKGHGTDNGQLGAAIPGLVFNHSIVRFANILDHCFRAGDLLLNAVARHVHSPYYLVLNDGRYSRRNISSEFAHPQYLEDDVMDISFENTIMEPPDQPYEYAFTQPTDINKNRFVTVISAASFPLTESTRFNMLGFLLPFQVLTWTTVLCSVLLCVVFLSAIEGGYKKMRNVDKRRKPIITSPIRQLELLMRIFYGQDKPWLPTTISATAILFGWGLFCSVFVSVYKSQMLSAMTIDLRFNDTPFNDFVSMKAAGFRLVGLRGQSAGLISQLMRDTNGTEDGNALRSILLPQVDWPTDATEQAAILASGGKIVTFAEHNDMRCYERPMEITYKTKGTNRPQRLESIHSAYAIPADIGNGNEIQKAIHRQMARLQETGVWMAAKQKERMATGWLQKNMRSEVGKCPDDAQKKWQALGEKKEPLNFKQMVSAFVLLAGGGLTAAIIYILECASQYKLKQQHDRPL